MDARDRCVILFGTQTGTAERFAKSLRAQLEGRYGGGTAFEALDIEQYAAPAQLPRERLVLLLMATYGDGDPTDSATEFWEWLSGAAEPGDQGDLLQGVSFGVFGLGNRQYEHFCAMGKKVSGAMRALGAAEVLPRGEGDDDKDIDADFDAWCGRLFDALDASPLVQKSEVICEAVDKGWVAWCEGGGGLSCLAGPALQPRRARRPPAPAPAGWRWRGPVCRLPGSVRCGGGAGCAAAAGRPPTCGRQRAEQPQPVPGHRGRGARAAPWRRPVVCACGAGHLRLQGNLCRGCAWGSGMRCGLQA